MSWPRSSLLGSAMVAALGLVSACSTTSASQTTGGYVSSDGTITTIPVADREPAPEVSGTTLDGDPLSLDDFAGDVVVINVWSSYCGPCREEAAALAAVANEFEGKGVSFVGVNIRDQEAAAQGFERTHDVPYPSLNDPTSQSLLGFTTYPPVAIPTTYVIDAQGRLAVRALDALAESTLRGLVEDVLADG